MIRLASLFWLALVVATGFATFKVKYAVQDIEEELNKVRKQTIAEQQQIHVLRAEWTSLNQPERLAELNRRFLSLAAVVPKQLQHKIEDIPLRPPPEPAEPVIASASTPEAAVAPPAMADKQLDAVTGPAPAAAAPPLRRAVANLQFVATAEAATAVATTASPATATSATLKQPQGKPEVRPQLAKASPAQQPHSLDRLIAEIAESR